MQILSEKGHKIQRYGDERIIKTFLHMLIEDIPTEWTYTTVPNDLSRGNYHTPGGRDKIFNNYRAGLFVPSKFGTPAGWPSPGIICARPTKQIGLYTGTRVSTPHSKMFKSRKLSNLCIVEARLQFGDGHKLMRFST